jgi:hypothetical protein
MAAIGRSGSSNWRSNLADVALIYQAQSAPSKLELLQGWVPNQPWLGERAGSRMADPAIAPVEISRITSGTTSVIRFGELELVVFHVLNDAAPAAGAQTLHGSWPGLEGSALLATAGRTAYCLARNASNLG